MNAPQLFTKNAAGKLVRVRIQHQVRYAGGRTYVYLAWRDGKSVRRQFLGTRRAPGSPR